jgi:hypothetical protein
MSSPSTHAPKVATAGGAAGSGSAATLRLEGRDRVTVFYDVAASTDAITVEVSTDGSTWRGTEHTVASGSVVTGGTTITFATGYEHVRAYAGSSFADADVNDIEVSAKG